MAKFVFKLQNVLNIKLNLEEQAKTHFAQMQAALNHEEEVLEGMFAHKRELEDRYRELGRGRLEIQELTETRNAIDYVRDEIKNQILVIKKAEKELEIARARLNEAIKERKTYDKLREHAFEDFLAEMNDEEKKEIDELVSYRFNDNSAV